MWTVNKAFSSGEIMGSDDQKIKQVPSAWEQNSLVQVTVLDECMCLAQCVIE